MTRIQQKIHWIKMVALQVEPPPDPNAFITTWNMTSGSFTLLTQTGTYNATIDWGDGQTSTHTTDSPTHTYASAGQYQIKISGQYNGLRINDNSSQKDKLIAINAWGNVGFTSFANAYRGCGNLVSLPTGSITGAENVTTFYFCFYGCTSLTAIPTDLFKYTVSVTSFHACFYGCTSLTAIPTDLFKYTVSVTYFIQCFYGCTSLTTIPTDLFKYTVSVTSFYGCFWRCTSLTAIPVDLFRYCVNVTSFSYCFYRCKNLALPTSIFNLTALQAKQPDMSYCFYVSSTADSPTGTVQPIWNYVTITAKNYCFLSCTALTNYSSIPELWR